MKKYLGLIAGGILAISGLEARAQDFIVGIVKGERYLENPVSPNSYTFTVETDKEFKTFTCFGDKDSARLDTMINPGDKVTVKLKTDSYVTQTLKDKDYSIDIEQVVEINGKKIK